MAGKVKISSKGDGRENSSQYGYQGNNYNQFGYNPSFYEEDIVGVEVLPEVINQRESTITESLIRKDDPEKGKSDAKRETGQLMDKELSEAAAQHDVKPKREKDKPVVLEAKDGAENQHQAESNNQKPPAKDKADEIDVIAEAVKGSKDVKLPTSNDSKIDTKELQLDVKEGGQELPVNKEQKLDDAGGDLSEVPKQEPSFSDFISYLKSDITEEQEREAASEARADLVNFAGTQKQLIQQRGEEQKAAVVSQTEGKLAQLRQTQEQETESIKSIYISAGLIIDNAANAEKGILQKSFEKNKGRIEADVIKQIGELQKELNLRRKEFTKYVEEQKKAPQQYAQAESDRADSELETASAKSNQIGNAEAAKHKGSEENKPQMREAAQKVASESAADIRSNKATIRKNLIEDANSFQGDYDKFLNEVLQELDKTETALKPAIEQKGKDSISKLNELHSKSVERIDQQQKSDKQLLSKGEAASLAKLRKSGNDTTEMLQKSSSESQQQIGNMVASITEQIDHTQRKYTSIIDQQAVPQLKGILDLSDSAKTEILEVSDAGSNELKNIADSTISAQDELVNSFTQQASELTNDAKTNSQGVSKAFSQAMKKIGEANQKESDELVSQTEKEQAGLIVDTIKGVDKFIQQRRDKLKEVNEQFKEKVKTKADESIEKAKLPLTDPLEERVAQAAQNADKAWWEGVLGGLWNIVKALIIVVAFAAFLIFIGVSGTALLIIGLVALAGFGLYEAYQRHQDGYTIGQSILWGFGDVIGYTGIYEGIKGEMVVPTGHNPVTLTTYERWRRGTEGSVNVLLLLAPLKGKIPGIRRLPGLPEAFAGMKRLVPSALLKEGAVLSKLFEGVSKGTSRVNEIISEGMKMLENRGKLNREGFFRWIKGEKPAPEGLPGPGKLAPEGGNLGGKEKPQQEVLKEEPVKENTKPQEEPVKENSKPQEEPVKENPKPQEEPVKENPKDLNEPPNRTAEELDDLAKDPAHGGKIDVKSIREREIGLELEKQGKLKPPIKRDPNPKGAEFIDGDGVKWDIKGFNSNFPPKKGGYSLEGSMKGINRELSLGENVIIDTAKMSEAHIAELKNEISLQGLIDKVIFF